VTLADGKLAVIQGLDDCIVVEADNVLLICRKADEQRIKQFMVDINMKFGAEYL
jgi:mannose-1-phosphate guanylyltransferase